MCVYISIGTICCDRKPSWRNEATVSRSRWSHRGSAPGALPKKGRNSPYLCFLKRRPLLWVSFDGVSAPLLEHPQSLEGQMVSAGWAGEEAKRGRAGCTGLRDPDTALHGGVDCAVRGSSSTFVRGWTKGAGRPFRLLGLVPPDCPTRGFVPACGPDRRELTAVSGKRSFWEDSVSPVPWPVPPTRSHNSGGHSDPEYTGSNCTW